MELEAPFLLAMVGAAVCVLPGVTVHPDSTGASLQLPRLFRIPEVGIPLAMVRELDGFMQARAVNSLRIAGAERGGRADAC